MNFLAFMPLLVKSRGFIVLSLLIVCKEINLVCEKLGSPSPLASDIKCLIYWNTQISFLLWCQWCLLHSFSQTVQGDQCRQSVGSTWIACLFCLPFALMVPTFGVFKYYHLEFLRLQIIICSLDARSLLLPASPPSHSNITSHSSEKHCPPL